MAAKLGNQRKAKGPTLYQQFLREMSSTKQPLFHQKVELPAALLSQNTPKQQRNLQDQPLRRDRQHGYYIFLTIGLLCPLVTQKWFLIFEKDQINDGIVYHCRVHEELMNECKSGQKSLSSSTPPPSFMIFSETCKMHCCTFI